MRILVYANVGLNLIDGSSIWVQSLAEVLSTGVPDCEVVVLSRDRLQGRGTAPALERLAGVTVVACEDFDDVVAQFPTPGDPRAVEQIILKLDGEERLDRFVIRAPDVALRLSRNALLASRLWAYVLATPEIGQPLSADLFELGRRAGGIFVQTDPQRAILEAMEPGFCNKTSPLPPMVKPIEIPPIEDGVADRSEGVRFVYSGKYSASWNVEAFFDIPGQCATEGIRASVTMIGDKVHNEKDDPGFRKRILGKFIETPGVTWLGAMERDDAIIQAAQHDLGLCWRTGELDDSLEISTKFLEFASQGVPAVVNRTAAYEALLGADYPYFATVARDVVSAARKVLDDPGQHAAMRAHVREVARSFTYGAAATRLRAALRVRPQGGGVDVPRNVLVASHDLKFLTAALDRLRESGRYRFTFDNWTAVRRHDPKRSARLLPGADVIFCEWCAGQAVWYSQRKLPHQKLYIRLHRFEAFTEIPHEVDITKVDGVIVVSDYLRDYCVREFGWPVEKLIVLPQYCVTSQFRRTKHPGYEHTMGLVGMNGFLKRPDRAVEVLRLVRQELPNFTLRVRSVLPWDIDWLWRIASEREKYEAFFADLGAAPDLREAVIFDRPGANMAEWFRNVGFVLSTSEVEGCHTAVAEGMASGAWPIVINWDGSESVYPGFVHQSVEEMAAEVVRKADSVTDPHVRGELMDEAAQRFDIEETVRQLEEWLG